LNFYHVWVNLDDARNFFVSLLCSFVEIKSVLHSINPYKQGGHGSIFSSPFKTFGMKDRVINPIVFFSSIFIARIWYDPSFPMRSGLELIWSKRTETEDKDEIRKGQKV